MLTAILFTTLTSAEILNSRVADRLDVLSDELPEQRRMGWKQFGQRCRSDRECDSRLECSTKPAIRGTCRNVDGEFCSRDRDCSSNYCRHGKCEDDSATARNGGGGFGRRRAEEDLDVAGADELPEQRRMGWGWKQFGAWCRRGECAHDLECGPRSTCIVSDGGWCTRDASCASNYCRNGECTEDAATARMGGGGFGRRRAEEDLDVAGEDLQMDLVEDEQDDRRRVVWCKTNKDCRTGWGERQCSQSGGFCVAGTGKGTTGNACSYDDHCNTNAGFTCTGSPSSIGTCQRRAPPPPSKKSNGQWCSWDGDCQSNFCRSGLCASKWGR